MEESIIQFPKQFLYTPEIIGREKLLPADVYVVAGMGGSHLAADLLRISHPHRELIIHTNYGLPEIGIEKLRRSCVIVSSYSGNTEEALDAFQTALAQNLNMAVITVGGTLLQLAQKHHIPYVRLPDMHVQPRMATGLSMRAIVAIMGDTQAEQALRALGDVLKPEDFKKEGIRLAKKLKGFVPIIYAGEKNYPLARNWKIKCNETGKIPAFCNYVPELNHNEMTGFDVSESTKQLSARFHFVFLKDNADDMRNVKRMEILERVYKKRNLPTHVVSISHSNVFYKIFSTLILADWTAYYIAREYGNDPEHVPMVEEFKSLMH